MTLLLLASPASSKEHVWPAGHRDALRHPALKPVRYHVKIHNSFEHLSSVTMIVDGAGPGPLDIAMPVWAPGAYRLIVPARNVQQLRALSGERRLTIAQLDRSTWRIQDPPPGAPIVIRYLVYHPKASVVRSHVSEQYAGYNPFDTFMYVVGNIPTPCLLTVTAQRGWEVATGLPREGGGYRARNYDVLIDSPILMGVLKTRSFVVAGRTHHLVWSG